MEEAAQDAEAKAFSLRRMALLRLLHHNLSLSIQIRLLQSELDRVRTQVQQPEARRGCRGGHPGRRPTAVPAGMLGSHASQVVQKVVDYTLQHYQQPMALREVAVHLKLNPNYLSNLFHKVKGVTYHHFLDDLRLRKARELLRDPLARICEVARSVGYASPNHFRAVFKAHVGLAPTTYRQNPA